MYFSGFFEENKERCVKRRMNFYLHKIKWKVDRWLDFVFYLLTWNVILAEFTLIANNR